MKLCRCGNGHYFDRDINPLCPYCSGEGRVIAEQSYPGTRQDAGIRPPAPVYAGPPPVREREKTAGGQFLQCEKGHIYDGSLYVACPYCLNEYPFSRLRQGGKEPACVYAGPPVSGEKSKKKSLLERLKKRIK